jgi:DNA-binding SARP family transcriptional activator
LLAGSSERDSVDFRILGPLQVSREGRLLDVGGHRQKVLVCLLLLHANEVISAERIIDMLWGETAPATARKALQVSVSRLRQILGAGVLETRAPGYLIRVQDAELDLQRFERLVVQGKQALASGDPGRAAVLLRKALTLWRGPALADVMYESFAQKPDSLRSCGCHAWRSESRPTLRSAAMQILSANSKF